MVTKPDHDPGRRARKSATTPSRATAVVTRGRDSHVHRLGAARRPPRDHASTAARHRCPSPGGAVCLDTRFAASASESRGRFDASDAW